MLLAGLPRSCQVQASEHETHEMPIAPHCVADAPENAGPMVFARIAMLKAITRRCTLGQLQP